MNMMADDFIADVADIDGDMMWGLDNLGAHHNIDVKRKLVAANVYPVFTPSQCTDVVAPVDHHVGAWILGAMAVLYEHALERNREAWENGELTAAERRIYIVNWVGGAEDHARAPQEVLRQYWMASGKGRIRELLGEAKEVHEGVQLSPPQRRTRGK